MKRLLTALLSITILGLVIWFIMPNHLIKTAIHQHPGIYDYKIFNNRTVESEVAEPWPLSNQYNSKELSRAILDSLKSLNTTAYLIIQNDSILFEYYGDEEQISAKSNSFSVAKSIVALLIGIAIDEEDIQSIDLTVDELLPQYENLHNHHLTLKDILTMSSGTSWDENYGSVFSITTKAYYGNNLSRLMKGLTIKEKPGVKFEYRSGDTQLLAAILKEATGKSLSEYASKKLWKKTGAEKAALWSLDKAKGTEKAYCCFNSNARDFARIGNLVLKKGKWNNKEIISESFIKEMITPAYHLKDSKGEVVDYYGYQWWIKNYKDLTIPYARGILGQYIYIIPEKNSVIVRLGHKRSDEKIGAHPIDSYTWINGALEILN
ncbi:serine hydrolase [Marinilabiliaceae bacterium ANBcel2]|nr:serine hydrolase [Marinilabiliaceae bacterium ANBcel2]